MKNKNKQVKILMILMLWEYCNYLNEIKEKNFHRNLIKQLEKDKNLSVTKWIKKYKPFWIKINKDEKFNKYLEEKPLIECDFCGSANVKCMGLGGFDKEFEIQMFKWECFTCRKKFEMSVNEKGEIYKK